jgi:hypothetical protein
VVNYEKWWWFSEIEIDTERIILNGRVMTLTDIRNTLMVIPEGKPGGWKSDR